MGCRQMNELALLYEQAKKAGLNTRLIMEQGLDTNEIKNIIKLHEELNNIFKQEEYLLDLYNENQSEEIKKQLKELSEEVKQIEFKLQKNWHFEQDEKYHTYWYQQPACSCPKLDNIDRFGYEYKVYSRNCILHGGEK